MKANSNQSCLSTFIVCCTKTLLCGLQIWEFAVHLLRCASKLGAYLAVVHSSTVQL